MTHCESLCFVLICSLCAGANSVFSQSRDRSVPVDVRKTLQNLLDDEDTDGDHRITVDDNRVPGTERGNKRFWFTAIDGRRVEVDGTAYLSYLLQELKLLEESGQDTAFLDERKIFEPPADRIARNIKTYYWRGLTRTIDEAGLPSIIRDDKSKTIDGLPYVYVPHADSTAFHYFAEVSARHPEWRLKVVRLPARIAPKFIDSLSGRHGILSLGLTRSGTGKYEGAPFVVPGGRFNEMYGWDSYFIVLGLLNDGLVDLARSMVDNLVYEINNYGAILNANRTYYLTRSQPPFLTSMALAVFHRLPERALRHRWLKGVVEAAIKEYQDYWMNDGHRTPIGLNRYFDSGSGVPPEVEPGHFDPVFRSFAEGRHTDARTLENEYRSGKLHIPELDAFLSSDRAMRESGHDTSYRLEGICANLATVDLNSLLYKIERDLAEILAQEFSGSITLKDGSVSTSAFWEGRAANRQRLINRYLWDSTAGMFYDYDFTRSSRQNYVSATTFYPLWAGLATAEQARKLVERALPMLEMPGGIAGSTEASRGPISSTRPLRQWDFPYGWAPHQMLVWQGLLNYGYKGEARRLAYKWLYTLSLNATQYGGTVPEKFDVVRRSHEVFAEYGNVGTTFSYITREGFGWTNASFQIGRALLPDSLLGDLNNLIPPEWIGIH